MDERSRLGRTWDAFAAERHHGRAGRAWDVFLDVGLNLWIVWLLLAAILIGVYDRLT